MATDQCLVFYSWASDHPNNTNRSLIETALQHAAKAVRADESIQIEPVIDRDTMGVPGSPDIASTIFAKIDHSQVFVCDITIVEETVNRPAPNPNVLIELGYALKTLGPDRIIMVMNTAFGKPELLPFDLRMRRVTAYQKPANSNDQGEARKQLEAKLTEALRTILQGIERPLPGEIIQPRTPAQMARESVEANQANRADRFDQYMISLGEQVAALTPKRVDNDQGHWDEQLVEAIGASTEMVLEFTQLAQTTVAHNSVDAIHALYEGFAHILELYRNPPGFAGHYEVSDFDLPRFVGHELFVTFCAFLVRRPQWVILADLLDSELYVSNANHGEPGLASFTRLSDFVRLLQARNDRLQPYRLQLRPRLLHADLLNERHTGTGILAQALPMNQFTAADYFLYLRGQLQPEQVPQYVAWVPWSVVYLNHPPRFLLESTRKRVAEPLARALGVENVEQFRTRFIERAGALKRDFFSSPWHPDPMEDFDPEAIGTR